MGVFGIVTGPGGGRYAGMTIQVYIPGGAKIPGEDTISTNRADDRNWERNLYTPGKYEVVLSDGEKEISSRVTVTIDGFWEENCSVKGSGSQWVKINFRPR